MIFKGQLRSRRCISEEVEDVYIWLLAVVWGSAALIASVVLPAWLLSLQLASSLASDEVDDVMERLGEKIDEWDDKEPLSEEDFERDVHIPVAMLIQTMDHFSDWGSGMFMTVAGCWTFSLCIVPTVVSDKHKELTAVLVIMFCVPFLVALAPANVSSSCDCLLDQLNELGLLGDWKHKFRVAALRDTVLRLTGGQGTHGHCLRSYYCSHSHADCALVQDWDSR